MIFKLYGKINEESIINAKICYDKKKYDLILTLNGINKRISIKKGINNSVHVEGISSFIHFLIELGVTRDNIILYLKYHYADGSTNGKGENRISVEECKKVHQKEIDELNKSLNTPHILKRAIHRFVIQGKNSGIPIDGLIYGIVNDSLFVTTEEIQTIIMSKINHYSTGVRFGCLNCQPMTRNLINNPKYENKRYCVQIKWYTIFDDIINYINKNI